MGNSSGRVCLDPRCGASSEGPLHLLRLHGDRGYWLVPVVNQPALGRRWRKIISLLPKSELTHGVRVDCGWLRESACLRACDSASAQLPPNHRISHKLNQHPQTRVLRCGELYPVINLDFFF